MEKVKSLTQKLIQNPKPKLWGITRLIGSFCSTAQAVIPAFLQIRYLQQQQVEYIKKQFPYHSIVHLNQNSIHEVVWWTKNLEISNGKSILSFINKTNNPSRCFSKGLGAYCQKISIGLRILQKLRLH